MNWINSSKKLIYVLSINILVLFAIFVVLELGFRLIFPEFKGHIHSEELTMGTMWGQLSGPQWLHNRIREQFDPLGLLNPGRFVYS